MSNSSDETARFALISCVLFISVGLSMFIVDIIGNILNSLAFTSIPQFNKDPSSIFLSILFIESQMDLITSLSLQLVSRISGSGSLTHAVILCKLRWYLGPVGGLIDYIVSVLLLSTNI